MKPTSVILEPVHSPIDKTKTYYAKQCTGELKYPCGNKDAPPYAIVLKGGGSYEMWDMNAFRPDMRYDKKLIQQLFGENNTANIIVVYKQINTDGNSYKIPKKIVWDQDDCEYNCENVRKTVK